MIPKSDLYIQGRIKWKAGKNDFPTTTAFYFDELEQDLKQKYEALLKQEEIGMPVLLFLGKSDNWTVVGTQKVAGGDDKSLISMSYDEIKINTVGDDPFNEINTKGDDSPEEFQKTEQDHLLLKNEFGELIKLYSAKGREVYALFNIIIMLKRMSATTE